MKHSKEQIISTVDASSVVVTRPPNNKDGERTPPPVFRSLSPPHQQGENSTDDDDARLVITPRSPNLLLQRNLQRNLSSPGLLDASPKNSHSMATASATRTVRVGPPMQGHELTPVIRNSDNDTIEWNDADVMDDDDDNYVVISPNTAQLQLLVPQVMDDRPAADDEAFHLDVVRPVPFPTQRKFLSFNGRQQYNHALEEENGMPNHSSRSGAFRPANPPTSPSQQPYQPSRDHSFTDSGLEVLPKEELSSIFVSSSSPPQPSSVSSLRFAIPLGERQWSIPSIRMAGNLNDTTTTDDEDGYLPMGGSGSYDDDASLSSRGSSLCLPDSADLFSPKSLDRVAQQLQQHQYQHPPHVTTTIQEPATSPNVVVPSSMEEADASSEAAVTEVVKTTNTTAATAAAVVAPSQKEKRKKLKERKAYEWLRTVEVERENDFLAEAASSKFLNAANHRQQGPSPPAAVVASPRQPTKVVSMAQHGGRVPLAPSNQMTRRSSSPPTMLDALSLKAASTAAATAFRRNSTTTTNSPSSSLPPLPPSSS
eukprot:scaffold3197_cov52-Attheya_sp.AAC.4